MADGRYAECSGRDHRACMGYKMVDTLDAGLNIMAVLTEQDGGFGQDSMTFMGLLLKTTDMELGYGELI